MNDNKLKNELEQLFAAGDAWLRKYGVVSNVAHNNIVVMLYMNFPKVRYVEYFITQNPEDRRIQVILHFGFWNLIFKNKEAVIDSAITLLKEYLHDYDITVELKRYKKGVEKTDAKANSSNGSSAKPD
jgi:hypothetical protein